MREIHRTTYSAQPAAALQGGDLTKYGLKLPLIRLSIDFWKSWDAPRAAQQERGRWDPSCNPSTQMAPNKQPQHAQSNSCRG